MVNGNLSVPAALMAITGNGVEWSWFEKDEKGKIFLNAIKKYNEQIQENITINNCLFTTKGIIMENRFYYNKKNELTGDFMPFYEEKNQTYHLFYICGCDWGHVSTKDFVNYKEHGIALKAGTVYDRDTYVFSGCILEKDSKYCIYYTGHNHNENERNNPYTEVILRATSNDLISWQKDKDFIIEPRDEFMPNAWRDPQVFYDENSKTYYMYFTAAKKEKIWKRWGCTVCYSSKDMYNWKYDGIAYEPDMHDSHECPDVFKIGDWYYLLFSAYTRLWETRYRMAKSPKGPWMRPKEDLLDFRSYYAAKTAAKNANERYLFGWACVRENFKDKNKYVWGGSLVPHKLEQKKDGTLYCVIPKSIENSFKIKKQLNNNIITGNITFLDNKYLLGKSAKFSYVTVFKENFDKDYIIKGHFNAIDKNAKMGIVLREDKNLEHYYMICFDELKGTVSFMRSCDYFDICANEEKNVSIKEYNGFFFKIVLSGSMIVIYVNDIVMSVRGHELQGGNIGIFAEEGQAEIEDLNIFEK